ncbi:unnamed protein product [Symbiodinium natans]|uniref:Uncharacterized protein n=1 Tax=Symbiodinium natans TaxID=878477 RepID=A0A812MU17_9DINO|nr:unnamed protein product [Symbiodinium natans]
MKEFDGCTERECLVRARQNFHCATDVGSTGLLQVESLFGGFNADPTIASSSAAMVQYMSTSTWLEVFLTKVLGLGKKRVPTKEVVKRGEEEEREGEIEREREKPRVAVKVCLPRSGQVAALPV